MENLQKLKEIIWAANPEITNQPCTHVLMHDENGCPFGEHNREIRLADVLLAIEQKFQFYASWTQQTNTILELLLPKYDNGTLVHDAYWDLTKDLEGQSTECIDFISKVLGV